MHLPLVDLQPPPVSTRRLLVIGDSVSVGYGDECGSGLPTDNSYPVTKHDGTTWYNASAFSPTENAYLAYGPVRGGIPDYGPKQCPTVLSGQWDPNSSISFQ
jgi:hypothetical protein